MNELQIDNKSTFRELECNITRGKERNPKKKKKIKKKSKISLSFNETGHPGLSRRYAYHHLAYLNWWCPCSLEWGYEA
jgi:hypothetical protein